MCNLGEQSTMMTKRVIAILGAHGMLNGSM